MTTPAIPLPDSCALSSLGRWLDGLTAMKLTTGELFVIAQAVRALIEAKCREVSGRVDRVFHPDIPPLNDKSLDAVTQHVLGAP